MDTPARLKPSALRTVARLAVCATALVFVFSAAMKVLDPSHFRDAVREQGVIPVAYVPLAAWAFTAVEGLCGLLALYAVLVDRRAPSAPWGARGLAALFAIIAVYAAVLVVKPPPKPTSCGCGLSTLPVDSWLPILVRSVAGGVALLALSFLLRPQPGGTNEPAGEPMMAAVVEA